MKARDDAHKEAAPGKVHDVASRVTASRGKVHEQKPNGVGADFTPEAALETAERLTEAAVQAKGKDVWRER